jgi:HAAS domain-containing protein
MTLIERYLQTVRIALPSDRRDDILRELSEDIHERVADSETELGRPLTEDEQSAILKQFGPPLTLATRYGPQRYVVGPALFPVYWQTLKIALGAAVLINVAIAIGLVAGGTPPGKVIGPLAAFPFTIAVTVFGWITLVFALLDLNLPRLLAHAKFDVKGLGLPRAEGRGRRWGLIAEIVGSTAFLIWWLAIPANPFLVFGPAAAFLAPAPIWQQLYLPVAAIWLASLAVLWAVLLRPDWSGLRTLGRLVSDGLGLVLGVVLLNTDAVVQLAPGVEPTANLLETVRFINKQAQIVFLIWVLAASWQIVYGLYIRIMGGGGRR